MYSPASATFGIIPTHLETRDVRCLVFNSRATHVARDAIKLQLANNFLFDPFDTIRLSLANALAHKQFQHFLFHSVVDAADHRDRRGSATRRAFAFF